MRKPSLRLSSEFRIRRSHWRSESVLADLGKLRLPTSLESDRADAHAEMWRNLVAEYDAVHLSAHLRQTASHFSDDFLAFEIAWARDELNHYSGLKQIYCNLFGHGDAEVNDRVRERQPDLRQIEGFVADEFTACACFAYDELASTRGYAEAFPFYDDMGSKAVSSWIRLVARDEMFHSVNAQNLLRVHHHERLPELPQVLRRVVESESADPEHYGGAFLFDHGSAAGNPFSIDFLRRCANDVCRLLNTAPAF